MKKIEELTEKEFKEEFIKHFGEDRWNQSEVLPILQEKAEILCSYLDIEEIPILCDPIKEDSRYYPEEKFIIISDKVILNEVEALKSLIHEIRHHFQYTCVSTNKMKEPMLEQWRKEIEIYDTLSPSVQLCTFLEIDAYAFTKVIMKNWFNKDIIFPDDEYEKAISLYIKKYLS
ncbi:MAG: hypothetical protein K2M08_07725 [Anaeroplasmataceae bacterium]|nr:hypothetical protein [Anaeroplasmataceae bacterium]